MFIVYDLIFLIFVLFYLLVYLLKGKFHRGFLRRLGFLPRALELARPIWVHAVSVGEAIVTGALIDKLRQEYPDRRLVISTVTPTGNRIAQRLAREGDFVTYLPLDFSFIINPVIRRVNPALFIIAETEIWPNLISALYKSHIPVVVVNARISDASFKGYRLVKFLLEPVLNKISCFCAQTETDAERLIRLGVSADKIKATGNMKFDLKPQVFSSDSLKLGLSDDDQLWVCGSTHPGEEEIILRAYQQVLGEFAAFKLLIAPRHPQRAGRIRRLIAKYGLEATLTSALGGMRDEGRGTKVFILDTIGQLMDYYAVADIVFIGGSLVRKGGHNILEPAWQGKPVLFGPYMHNFRGIAQLFLENNAAIMVHGADELAGKIKGLLSRPQDMLTLGARGKELILANQGATLRNLKEIRRFLS